ncbi:hypothetical protein [Salegentibacter lacus]|uniref:hypothetical protein n=1 Tax=Salegentibacter lacus TaxID=2873599 RepID=UPI003741E96B
MLPGEGCRYLKHLVNIPIPEVSLYNSVRVSESLVDKNPSDLNYHYSLLSIYLRDTRYKDKFIKIKDNILKNFKTDEEERMKFEVLNYEE